MASSLLKKKIWLMSFCALLLAQFAISKALPQAATAVIPTGALPSHSGLSERQTWAPHQVLSEGQSLAFAMPSFSGRVMETSVTDGIVTQQWQAGRAGHGCWV